MITFEYSGSRMRWKSQNLMSLSAEPEANPVLSGRTSIDQTGPVCALMVSNKEPEERS